MKYEKGGKHSFIEISVCLEYIITDEPRRLGCTILTVQCDYWSLAVPTPRD